MFLCPPARAVSICIYHHPQNAPKLVHDLLGDAPPVLLASDRVGQDDLVDELAHRLLETPVALVVVRAGEARREPGRLRVGDLRKSVCGEGLDLRLLAFDGTDLQACVLRAVEHFLPVQAEECIGGIFPCCLSATSIERYFTAMEGDTVLPMESTSNTAAPPGCKLANLETSYTRASTMIHWKRRRVGLTERTTDKRKSVQHRLPCCARQSVTIKVSSRCQR